VWLTTRAVGLLDHLTDSGCDQEFAMCITDRQQLARFAFAALSLLAAATALASVLPILRATRLRRWHLVVPAVLIVVAFMAITDPEAHLHDNTQWFAYAG